MLRSLGIRLSYPRHIDSYPIVGSSGIWPFANLIIARGLLIAGTLATVDIMFLT